MMLGAHILNDTPCTADLEWICEDGILAFSVRICGHVIFVEYSIKSFAVWRTCCSYRVDLQSVHPTWAQPSEEELAHTRRTCGENVLAWRDVKIIYYVEARCSRRVDLRAVHPT